MKTHVPPHNITETLIDPTNGERGFNMIELIVSISILLVITSIAFFNQSAFRSNIQLENLAYETALALRQAQVYGTSVRSQLPDFDVRYGVWFTENNPDQFIIFSEPTGSGNNRYNNGEEVEIFSLRGAYSITDLCVENGGSEDCDVDELAIMFERPNPNAVFWADGGSGYDSGRIEIQAADGRTKSVEVIRTGHISVD